MRRPATLAFENTSVISFFWGERVSKRMAMQLQLNVVQDGKGRLRELLVTNCTYGFALIGFMSENSIAEPEDDCGKVELERGLAVS